MADGLLLPRASRRRLRSAPAYALIAPALALLLALFVAPIGRTIALSLQEEGGRQGIGWYAAFFQSPSYLLDLWFTFWTAGLSVLGATILALPLALALRRGGRVAPFLYVAVLTPLLVPHLIAAYAIRLTLAGSGPIFGLLVEHWHLLGSAPPLVNEWAGLVIALVWKFFPVMTLTLLAGLESVPEQVQEAARDLGASTARRLREVTIPLLTPALLAGGVLVFVLAASQFSITLVIYGGAKVTTLPLDIYFLTFGQSQQPYGSAVGIVFTFVTLAMLAITTTFVRSATSARLGRSA